MDKIAEMKQLIKQLNYYTQKYDTGKPDISDRQWDDLYFQLIDLEKETEIVLGNSPSISISYTVVSELNKVAHDHKMLSLDKTKVINEVYNFLGKKNDYIAMCKMDGLTCTLKYENGILVSAQTRGDGEIGEDITHNAMVIDNIPKHIKTSDEVFVVDGEIISTYQNFRNFEQEYKNPRNFAAGSIRLLDNLECKKRHLSFVAWDIIQGCPDIDSLDLCLEQLADLGFTTVPHTAAETLNNADNLDTDIKIIESAAKAHSYPIDGVVFKFDSRSYGKTLGSTSHHFKNAIAYKFYDELYPTKLKDIEWTMGRTGILTPVAIFEPVDIEGSVVSRASLHNISIMSQTLGAPYKNEELGIYKANMIIPQIGYAKQTTNDASYIVVPKICPICGGATERIKENDSEFLRCSNPQCSGKLINQLDHFCGKKGLDIKGLSVQTLAKLIEWGWVTEPIDIYFLQAHASEWKEKTGFGEKSVENILNAIKASETVELWRFISALGIPLIGATYSKQLSKNNADFETFKRSIESQFDFTTYEGFGEELSKALLNFNYTKAEHLVYPLGPIHIINSLYNTEPKESSLKGLSIVITGKLNSFKNRNELKEEIENRGGKVASAVSGNTSLLINNDTTSNSAKNRAAKDAGIDILSEEEFIKKFLTK